MKKTKIIFTVGPSTDEKEIIKELVINGANIVRFNMAHATYDFCDRIIEIVRKIEKELDTSIGIMADLVGPSLRLGKIENDQVELKKDQYIKIYNHDVLGNSEKLSLNYDYVVNDIKINDKVILCNNAVRIEITKRGEDYVEGIILNDGVIMSHKAVHLPDTMFDIPYISKKDHDDIVYAVKKNIDFLGLSYVRSCEDVLGVIDLLIELGNDNIDLIAKIECLAGFNNLVDILKVSDGVMVARGDLGIELPLEKLPFMQKSIVETANNYNKISVVATEMLMSMEEKNVPTRAEVSDVYNAVVDGCDAVMLSDETTIGKFPIETVNMMKRIIESAEEDFDYLKYLDEVMRNEKQDITTSIAFSVVDSALRLKAKMIVASTNSGYTAKKISRFRPICPIIATTPNKATVRSLTMNYGIYPKLVKKAKTTDEIVERCKKAIIDENLEVGDKYIITGGFPVKSNNTNFMKIDSL